MSGKGTEGEVRGILIQPIVTPSIIRQLLYIPTLDDNDGGNFDRVKLVLGKETYLSLVELQLQPTPFNFNSDPTLLGDTLINLPDLKLVQQYDIPVFGTIKDLKLVKLEGEFVLAGVSDAGKLSMLKLEVGGEVSILREILLDLPGHHYQYLGRTLAVDPKARSFAVAAWLSQFRIFFLPQHLTTTELPEAVLEDWTFSLQGIIWSLVYLYPNPTSEARPNLVLIVFDDIDKSANLVLYEFFNSTSTTIQHQISRLPLGNMTVAGDGLPLHLIPLSQIPEALLVITETQIMFITSDDVTSGVMLFPRFDLPSSPNGQEAVLITCWADPSLIDRSLNYLYLGCDFGNLYRLDVIFDGTNPQLRLTLLGQIGQGSLGPNLVVLQHRCGRDLLAYSGDFSDGGILWMDPFASQSMELAMKKPKHKLSKRSHRNSHRNSHRKEATKTIRLLYPDCRLASWGPVIDFEMVTPPASSLHYKHSIYPKSILHLDLCNKDPFILDPSPIIYTCAGVHPHGAIHSIQFGHLTESHDLTPDGIPNGQCIRNMFRIHLPKLTLIGLSFPHATKLFSEHDLEDCTESVGIQSHLESIYIGSILFPDGSPRLIQVTSQAILIYHAEHAEHTETTETTCIELDDGIVLAAVTESYLVITTTNLELIVFSPNGPNGHVLDRLVKVGLADQPSCLSVANQSDGVVVLVGTYQPSLKAFQLQMDSNQLECLFDWDLVCFESTELGIPHSILVQSHLQSHVLLVGLRDGFLLKWVWATDPFDIQLTHITQAGTLPVSLASLDSKVVVLSNTIKLYQPDFTSPDRNSAIQTLILNDLVGPIGNPSHVIPFCDKPNSNALNLLYTDIDSTLHLRIAEIADHPNHHPYRLPIKGTPKRLVYHNKSSNLVVLAYIPSTKSTSFSCFITVVDPVSGAVLDEQKAPDCEQGYALLEWDVESARAHNPLSIRPIPGRSLFLLATGPVANGRTISALKDFGSVYSFHLEYSESHTRLSPLTRLVRFNSMVTCMEQYHNFLLVGVGDILHLYDVGYDNGLSSVSLELLSSRELGDKILAISAHHPTISVATQPTSVFFFTVDDGSQLQFTTSGRYARRAVACLQVEPSLNVACDRAGGSLFALQKTASVQPMVGDISVEYPCQEIFSFYLGEGATRLKRFHHPTHWQAVGCTLLGTLFCIVPLSLHLDLLSTLQLKLATFSKTRPRLGNDYIKFRAQAAVQPPQLIIIDGWLLRKYQTLNEYQKLECLATFSLKEPCCRALKVTSYEDLYRILDRALRSLNLSQSS